LSYFEEYFFYSFFDIIIDFIYFAETWQIIAVIAIFVFTPIIGLKVFRVLRKKTIRGVRRNKWNKNKERIMKDVQALEQRREQWKKENDDKFYR